MENKIVVLIADDDMTILKTLEKYIGFNFPESQVITADNGNTAWSLINQSKPSIIISDITMPGYSGIELLKKVRNDVNLKDMYFILLTAAVENELRVICLGQVSSIKLKT